MLSTISISAVFLVVFISLASATVLFYQCVRAAKSFLAAFIAVCFLVLIFFAWVFVIAAAAGYFF